MGSIRDMGSHLYDQERELDFSWVERVHHRPPSGRAEDLPSTEWHAPSFVCKREMPTKRRSFVLGVGGALDFLGLIRFWNQTTLYRIRELPPNRANALAIYGDWCAVGEDMNNAVREFERTELEHVEIHKR